MNASTKKSLEGLIEQKQHELDALIETLWMLEAAESPRKSGGNNRQGTGRAGIVALVKAANGTMTSTEVGRLAHEKKLVGSVGSGVAAVGQLLKSGVFYKKGGSGANKTGAKIFAK